MSAIDNILQSGIILAPMAGYGDAAFRRLCCECGAGLTVTEMVSVAALKFKNKKTPKLLMTSANEQPVAVQLFGHNPEDFYEVIKDNPALDKFDLIDINMGCPVKKVIKNHEGAALLNDILLAAKIVESCKRATDKPVSVKTRLGFFNDTPQIKEFANAVQSAGADMLTIHGRYAQQMYLGSADWQLIGEIAATATIPVVGNGDIISLDMAKEFQAKYKTAGVMIGRAAVGNPQIFGKSELNLKQAILKQIEYNKEYYDKKNAAVKLRKHLHFYLKGVEYAKQLKQRINFIDDIFVMEAEIQNTLHD